jgi:peptidoglycan L-alanyl-D-glutamate endopeptidase CwlK
MNSKIIFDFIRPKLGSTQAQYDALLRLLNAGANIEDLSIFVGMSKQQTDGLESGGIDKKTGNFQLSQRSLDRLNGVHPNLVKVVKRAIEISEYDFMVVEGLRTIETQKKYVAEGKSKTMNSYHLTGHAVDLAPLENGTIDWNNKKGQFDAVAKAMKQAAKDLNISVEWGGDWKSFVDKPHFQIKR